MEGKETIPQNPDDVLGLTGVALGDIQHVEQETEFAGDAEFAGAEMLQQITAQRLEKVKDLEHGVTVGVGNVGFQPGDGSPVVQTEIKVV